MRLKKSTLMAYSLTDMPVMMSIFPVMVFVPRFYANDLAVPLAVVGTIMLMVRMFDVVTDPLMGYISDHTRSRFGRRRPWIALATPIMMLSIYQLFMPPEGAGAMHLLMWSMLLSVSTTMMLIPYYAWGAELSPEYNERSRITGARAMMGVLGQFTAQAIPSLALLLFAIGGSAAVLEIVGVTMLIIMPLCVAITLGKTPESQVTVKSVVPIKAGLKLMWSNGPFKQLVVAFMIGSLGLSITTPLYLFFIADVLKAEDRAIYMLAFFYITNFASVPLWVWLAGRIGKHKAYIASFALIGCAHPFYMLLGEGDFWWMLPITIATGFAAGGFSQALPNSMKADVIDLDTLESGESRAGTFFSAWSFVQKAAASIGSAMAIFGLAMFGFEASPTANHSPEELWGLRFLFSTFPSIFFFAGAAVIWKYPITPERHAEIRRDLDLKFAGTGGQ
ncbi:MAG: MFS transporter [Gammaproteobacteria bacterium]|nr:MFS transporter [Gammaproteobacteria bacterium]